MPWQGFPITSATSWQSLNWWNQFAQAIGWRQAMIYLNFPLHELSPNTLFIEDDGNDRYQPKLLHQGDLPTFYNTGSGGGRSTPIVMDMQAAIEDLAIRFIDIDNFSLQGQSFINTPIKSWFFTLASWRAKAGLHADGFKRMYRDDSGNWVTAYGFARHGDYIGPWVFDELKAGLDVLTHTLILPSTERYAGTSLNSFLDRNGEVIHETFPNVEWSGCFDQSRVLGLRWMGQSWRYDPDNDPTSIAQAKAWSEAQGNSIIDDWIQANEDNLLLVTGEDSPLSFQGVWGPGILPGSDSWTAETLVEIIGDEDDGVTSYSANCDDYHVDVAVATSYREIPAVEGEMYAASVRLRERDEVRFGRRDVENTEFDDYGMGMVEDAWGMISNKITGWGSDRFYHDVPYLDDIPAQSLEDQLGDWHQDRYYWFELTKNPIKQYPWPATNPSPPPTSDDYYSYSVTHTRGFVWHPLLYGDGVWPIPDEDDPDHDYWADYWHDRHRPGFLAWVKWDFDAALNT